MSKAYLGIDPGNKGYLSCQCDGEWSFFSIVDHDMYELYTAMVKLMDRYSNIVCVIEDVHALFMVSAKSTFEFGFNKGYLEGMLVASKMPYILVSPKDWQKEMWVNSDKVYKTLVREKGDDIIHVKQIDTKSTSINAAKRLFPALDFRRNTRCKNVDDNKVDATLMSEYARRKNL